jgi:tetratricopeptide (TPR) repeat protein
MLRRPLAIALAVSLGALWALAQSQSVLETKPTAVATPADTPKPQLSAEMRGDIFMARKMYREAIETFREGPPKDPVLFNKMGIAYHQMMQLDNARKSYEQALKYKPDYVEAMNNIGTVYYAKKSYRRAISWYHKALKAAPVDAKSASIHMNLGTALFARKKYEEATMSYQTALKLDPEVFERHGNFGVLLEERSVEEKAKYHFYLAKLYAKDGRSELAMQYLRKCLEEGFKERKKLETDTDFAALRELPEFKVLLASEPRVL